MMPRPRPRLEVPARARQRRPIAPAWLALLALWPACVWAATSLPPPLVPFRAQYDLGNNYVSAGTTTISLQSHEGGWRYRSVSRATNVFRLFVDGPDIESSQLEEHDGRLRPLHYRHVEAKDGAETTVAFDWAQRQATIHTPDGARTQAITAQTTDGFAATLRLIRAVADGKQSLSLPVIDDDGDAQQLRFKVVKHERIEVPFGSFDTVRVDRIRKDSKRETITWLAPKLHWVAARIEQRKSGDLVGRLELTALNGESGDSGSKEERCTPPCRGRH